MTPGAASRTAPIPVGAVATGLCLAVYCVLFLTNLDIFLTERGISPVGSLETFVAGCALLLGVQVATVGFAEVYGRLEAALLDGLAPLIGFLVYVAVNVVLATTSPVRGQSVDLTQIFPVFQFAVLCFGMVLVASRPAERAFRPALRLAVVVLGASIVYETLAPGALDTESTRSGGFALNANVGAFLLTGMLATMLDFRQLRAVDVAFILITALPVFCTLSRGGLAQLLLVCGAFAAVHATRALARGDWRLLGGIAATLAALALLMVLLGQAVRDTPAAADREFSERIAQLTFQGDNLTDDPYRGVLAHHYLDLALTHPVAGLGTGYTLNTAVPDAPFGKGPHNIYLRIWLDTGLSGLVAYVGFLAALMATALRRRHIGGILLCAMIAAYGFFDHNVIDNKAILLLVGASLAVRPHPGRRDQAGAA